jgi:hypothetical protein
MLVAVNILLPQCSTSEGFEGFLLALCFALFFLTFGPIVIYGNLSKENEKNIGAPFFFGLAICFAPLFFSSMHRHSQSEIQYTIVSGPIQEKFISNNHAAKTFTINGKDYAFLPKDVWDNLKIGDIITKRECSNIVTINSDEYTLAD